MNITSARHNTQFYPNDVLHFNVLIRSQYKLVSVLAEGDIASVHYDKGTDNYIPPGRGVDIWGICDQFHFAHKTLRGDRSTTAKIDSIERVHVLHVHCGEPRIEAALKGFAARSVVIVG